MRPRIQKLAPAASAARATQGPRTRRFFQSNDDDRFVNFYGLMSRKPDQAVFFLFLLGLFFDLTRAQADLSEEEKAEKRLQFNAYVEEELASVAQAKAPDTAKAGPQWFFSVEPSVTYDSNVNLNSKKKAALNRQLRSALGFKEARPEVPLLGAGQWGMSASADRADYHGYNTLDYTDSAAKIFMTSRFGDGLTLKTQYEFGSLYYPKNDQLNFLSHKVRAELFHEITKNFGHTIYASLRFKDYV